MRDIEQYKYTFKKQQETVLQKHIHSDMSSNIFVRVKSACEIIICLYDLWYIKVSVYCIVYYIEYAYQRGRVVIGRVSSALYIVHVTHDNNCMEQWWSSGGAIIQISIIQIFQILRLQSTSAAKFTM